APPLLCRSRSWRSPPWMTPSLAFRSSGLMGVSSGYRLGAGRDRRYDVVIAGAAAQIAFELVTDGVIVEVVALAVHHVDRGHDHAGGAIAALQAVVLAEGLLHRMQRAVRVGEPFDRSDGGAFDLPGEDGAGLHRLAVDVHHTGPALRRVTADMGTGEAKVLAQELHQQGARIDVTGDGLAVHRHRDGGHGFPPRKSGQRPRFWGRLAEPAADQVEIGSILP